MLITQQGKILRMVTADIRPTRRVIQGVRLIEIDEDDRVMSLARLAAQDAKGAGRTRRQIAMPHSNLSGTITLGFVASVLLASAAVLTGCGGGGEEGALIRVDSSPRLAWAVARPPAISPWWRSTRTRTAASATSMS